MCFIGIAQTKQIRGVVKSANDSLPIPYANVYNDKYKFGSITNELGEFVLNCPDSISSLHITISNMGYSTEYYDNTDFPKIVYLKENIVQLDDVVLVGKEHDIKNVLDKVYSNIKDNYSNKRHLLKAFYRQTAFRVQDSSYLRVVEADVGIQEYGILKALDRDRIKINQFRKSDNKITKTWYHKIANKIFGKQNYLVWIKKLDFVKNFVKFKDYHSHYNHILDNYTFEFSRYEMIGEDLVGVYNYFRKKYVKSDLTDSEKSKLFINLKDYAIIKVVQAPLYGPASSQVSLNPSVFIYNKIGNYYYLSSISRTRFLSGKNDDEKQYETDQLFTYQVFEDRKAYDKIKRKDKEVLSEDIYDKVIVNDTLFWNNYEMPPLVPLEDKYKMMLQKNKNLKQQFVENGK